MGTRFWKEFRFGGRKVETRFLRKDGAGELDVRELRVERGADRRELAPADGLPNVAEIAPGQAPQHSVGGGLPRVPRQRAARRSWDSTALQLSTDRDPLAPHAEPLAPTC